MEEKVPNINQVGKEMRGHDPRELTNPFPLGSMEGCKSRENIVPYSASSSAFSLSPNLSSSSFEVNRPSNQPNRTDSPDVNIDVLPTASTIFDKIITSPVRKKKNHNIFRNLVKYHSSNNLDKVKEGAQSESNSVSVSQDSESSNNREQSHSIDSSNIIPKNPNPFGLPTCKHPSLWTDKMEDYFLKYIDICHASSEKCRMASVKHQYYDKLMCVFNLCSGSVIFITSFDYIPDITKAYVAMACGIATSLVSAVQSKCSYDRLSEVEKESHRKLDKLAQMVKLELTKEKKHRVNPLLFMVVLENNREKILRQINIEDE